MSGEHQHLMQQTTKELEETLMRLLLISPQVKDADRTLHEINVILITGELYARAVKGQGLDHQVGDQRSQTGARKPRGAA